MQVLIELDPETLRRLEKVAPGKSRKRSAFIRAAIQRSLWEIEEEKTRQAYAREPDGEPAPFDPATWEPLPYGGFDPPKTQRARANANANATKKKRSSKRVAAR